ncbi:MAG: Eco57I restriction-modification methylase domain-containing protein, partial [Anaerolineales bacterium]
MYDQLLRYLERWYNEEKLDTKEKAERVAKAKNHGCVLDEDGHWRLGLKLRRRVLTDCVYGVDIDRQAVEVSQLSLYLKLLENESASTARQFMIELGGGRASRLLPDLTKNIVCGNSLVDWESVRKLALSPDEEKTLNPLNFSDEFPEIISAGGFDAIVGNPPYEVVEKARGEASWPHDLFMRAADRGGAFEPAFGGKLNLFRFFIVRAIQLTTLGGR